MNNTIFKNSDIISILNEKIFTDPEIISESLSYCNDTFVEFSDNHPIEIESVEGNNIISIDFKQNISECECCGSFTYRYTIVLSSIYLKKLIDENFLEN